MELELFTNNKEAAVYDHSTSYGLIMEVRQLSDWDSTSIGDRPVSWALLLFQPLGDCFEVVITTLTFEKRKYSVFALLIFPFYFRFSGLFLHVDIVCAVNASFSYKASQSLTRVVHPELSSGVLFAELS